MDTRRHLVFWIAVIACLTVAFGIADGDFLKSFLFVTFLMPAAIGTSYLFNLVLVPKYLMRKKYFSFGLYLLYTLIFSLYLEMLALTFAFIFLGNFRFDNLNPYATDLIALTATLYLIVFIDAFIQLMRRYQNKEHLILELKEKKERDQQQQIIVRSDRKNRPISLEEVLYIESLSDYVKIHLNNESIITREKISVLAGQLPSSFLRIHRSFIVNTRKIESFNAEQVVLNEQHLPISRSYKQEALDALAGNVDPSSLL